MLGVLTNFFDEEFWLPDQVTWDSFSSTPQVRYVEAGDLYVCFFVVPAIFLLRSLFLVLVAPNLGRRLGLKDRNAGIPRIPEEASSAILRDAFKASRTPSPTHVAEIVKRTDLSEAYVLDWFRRQRHVSKSSSSSRLAKFSECCLYFVWYAVIFCYGVFALHDKCWLLDTRHFWKDYPRHPLSNDLYVYYVASISFYLSEVVATAFKTIKRKDDLQMTIHHLVTLSLLFFSWWTNHCRIGSVVLVLHDFADIWLQLGKMARYVEAHKLCDAAFAVFTVSWFVTRLVLFPLYPVYSVAFETQPYVDYFQSGRVNVWHASLGLLLALVAMNFLWFARIVAAIVEKFRSGQVVDNRSDDED